MTLCLSLLWRNFGALFCERPLTHSTSARLTFEPWLGQSNILILLLLRFITFRLQFKARPFPPGLTVAVRCLCQSVCCCALWTNISRGHRSRSLVVYSKPAKAAFSCAAMFFYVREVFLLSNKPDFVSLFPTVLPWTLTLTCWDWRVWSCSSCGVFLWALHSLNSGWIHWDNHLWLTTVYKVF